MKSVTTEKFRKAFARLPKEIQEKARLIYKVWQIDSAHKSLHFKKVYPNRSIYSIRIGLSYRALGVENDNIIIWFWIGSHEDYNNLLSQL